MNIRIDGIADVAERNLCLGCGVCAYVQPDIIRMVDDLDAGRRPTLVVEAATDDALAVCPGVRLDRRTDTEGSDLIPDLLHDWGPVLEVWEGHAADEEIRFSGSSGGVATALALYAVERWSMAGVLHVAGRDDVPYLNETVFSRTRDDLVKATGSRYAPASPCDGLDRIESADGPCVFIGKPCDVAGAYRAAELRAELKQKLGLTVAMFCAGTPTYRGTLEMFKEMGIDDPSSVTAVRYRGLGWPGKARATVASDDASGSREYEMTYDESWNRILQRHRQWRCHVCADHTGEFADVAVGDPWYREIEPGEMGQSLVLVRTARGRDLVHSAVEDGVLSLRRVRPELLPASQPNLRSTRGAVWGRNVAMRFALLPAPRYRGMNVFSTWWRHLGWAEKGRSIVGTVRRIWRKRLYRRTPVKPFDADSSPWR